MKKINLNKEAIGNIAKKGCKFVFYSLATVLPYISVKDTLDTMRYIGYVDYSDTVGAIMESGMFSSDKSKIVAMLKKDGNTEYYKSIIQVVRSSMYSSDKVKLIQTINEK